jgi:hypothetical protein
MSLTLPTGYAAARARSCITNNLFRHVIRPARGGAGAVIVVFALLLGICAKGGLMGIPLACILIPWLFKYSYILFDHVVRGFDEPPTLDIQMVNPFNEQRPLAQLAIAAPVVAAVLWLARLKAPAAATCLAAVGLLLLPASVILLGLEGNVFKALYPVALLRVVKDLGLLYLTVLGAIAAYVLLLLALARLDLWLPLELATGMFALLSIFSLLGGVVYERRHALGLETWHSPEQAEERQRLRDIQDSEAIVTESYGLMRVGAHTKAWAMLQAWLATRRHAIEDYRWLCDRVGAWNDSRYANRLTEDYVARLLRLKRTGEALDAVAGRLRADPAFRPKTAADTLCIAQLAVRGGGRPSVARALLGDFASRFKDDPNLRTAAALRSELARRADP